MQTSENTLENERPRHQRVDEFSSVPKRNVIAECKRGLGAGDVYFTIRTCSSLHSKIVEVLFEENSKFVRALLRRPPVLHAPEWIVVLKKMRIVTRLLETRRLNLLGAVEVPRRVGNVDDLGMWQ